MYRFLLTRQWVILTLVGLALIPVMIKLGFWQLSRHEHRVEHNEQVSKSLNAPAVPVGELTEVGRAVAKKDTWRKVTASGTYDTRHEVVVRQRTGSDDQSIGYFVVTPLVLADGKAVLVNRGWIPAPGNLTRFPKVPAPPTGKVTVTGRLKADETTGSSGIKDKKGLPPRQVMLINSERQAEDVGRPLLNGYIELTGSKPGGSNQPEPVPAPDTSGIGPHMAYAIQWWLFTAAVPAGWVVLFRRELRDQAAAAAKAAKDAEQAGEQAPTEPADPPDGPGAESTHRAAAGGTGGPADAGGVAKTSSPPQAGPGAEGEAETQGEAEAEAEPRAESAPGTAAETAPKVDTGIATETRPGSEAEPKVDTGTATETRPGSEAEPEAGTEAGTGTGTATEVGTEAEPEGGSGTGAHPDDARRPQRTKSSGNATGPATGTGTDAATGPRTATRVAQSAAASE